MRIGMGAQARCCSLAKGAPRLGLLREPPPDQIEHHVGERRIHQQAGGLHQRAVHQVLQAHEGVHAERKHLQARRVSSSQKWLTQGL